MKKRILAAVLLVCMLLSVSSCAKKPTLSSIYDEAWLEQVEEASPPHTHVEELNEFEGMSCERLTDSVVHFYKTVTETNPQYPDEVITYKKYIIYNYVTNKILLEGDDRPDTEKRWKSCNGSYAYDNALEGEVFWVTYYDEFMPLDPYSTVLYDANGQELATVRRTVTPNIYANRITFDSRVFVPDRYGNINEVKASDGEFSTLTADVQVGDLYYDQDNSGITAYDREGKYLNSYTYRYRPTVFVDYTRGDEYFSSDYVAYETIVLPPTFIIPEDLPTVVFLNNGNLLIQYQLLENAEATSYTYLDENENKITLKTYLWDPVSAREKEIDFDYFIERGFCRANPAYAEDIACYHTDIENVVTLLPIVDKRLIETECEVWSVSDKGKLQTRLNSLVPNQSDHQLRVVAPGRYLLENDMGHRFLLDEYGNILAELTEATQTKSFLIWNGGIYDYNLNLLYDFGAKGMTLTRVFDYSVILQNEDGDYLYANGECHALPANGTPFFENHTFKGGYIVWQENGTKMTSRIYNDRGDLLYEGDGYIYSNFLKYDQVDGYALLQDFYGHYYRVTRDTPPEK